MIVTYQKLKSKQLAQGLMSLGLVFLLLFASTSLNAQRKKEADNDSLNEKKSIEARFYFFNALKEKNLGNLDLALDGFKKAIAADENNDAAYYESARIAAQKNNFAAALEMTDKALAINKDNNYYKLLGAELCLQTGKIKDALKRYEDILKSDPENLESYLAIAAIYENQNDYKSANKYYSLAEQRTGVVYEISQQKIANYIKAGKYELAMVEVNKLIKDFPEELAFRELLADLYSYNKQLDKAEQELKNILRIDPSYGNANLRLAKLSLAQKQWTEALAYCHSAFILPALSIDAKMELLFILFDFSNLDKTYINEILKLTDEVVMAHQDDAKSYSIKGDFLNREEKFVEARVAFKKAVSLAPDKYLIWQEIVNIDSRLNELDTLIADCEKAQTLFPNIPLFYFYNGLGNYQLKRYEKSIQQLESGLDLVLDNDQQKVQFMSLLGDAYNGAKNYKKSDENYDKSLKISPDDVYVLNNYSYFLSLRAEKLEKAKEMAERAIKLAPNQPSYIDTYAWVLYKMKDYKGAKLQLEKAFALGGNSGEMLEHYGDIQFQLGNLKEALEYWKKAKVAGDNSDLIDKKIADQKLYE